MRGQIIGLLSGTGKVLVYALILFVVIGAIVGAGLIDSNNPFYDAWQKFMSYGNTAFTLIAIGVLAAAGFWILRQVI